MNYIFTKDHISGNEAIHSAYYNDRILYTYHIPHHTRMRLTAASPATNVQ